MLRWGMNFSPGLVANTRRAAAVMESVSLGLPPGLNEGPPLGNLLRFAKLLGFIL